MKRFLCFFLSLVMLFALAAPAFAAQAELTLAANGATDYRIVVSQNAAPAERTAADTLADYLHRITGATFPVATDAEPAAAKELVVGETVREPAFDRSGWDEDAVRILTDG